MVMIKTVQERQRGAYNFENYYENLCALQDTCPIPAVKGHLHEGIFDINGDGIRQQDWHPIFNSIKINKSLKFIAVRSYFLLNLDNGMPEKKAKIMRSRIPIIRTKEMTANLCRAIRDCLITTENLECLELQGIHLRESDITTIGQGLMKNSTLKHLSLESCRIGDTGLLVLCSAMKMAGNISTLNLTSCSLSPVGISGLGDLIKFQAMTRHNEAWKESLRYRWANFDMMCGLRRMTLNRNLGIGDEGSLLLAESLKDDLWVKAIDLQECSLTNASVRGFLKVLKYNSTLVVLDLRRNPMIDRDLLKSVTEQVLVNGDGKETEYKWLRVKDLMRNADENNDRHPRSFYNGPSKPLDYVARPAFKPAGRLRSKSASSVDRKSNESRREEMYGKPVYHDFTQMDSARNVNLASKGRPWRTAARATRYKGYPSDHIPGKSNIEEHFEEYDKFQRNEKFTKKQERTININHSENKSKNKVTSVEKQNSITTEDETSTSVVSPLINGTVLYPPIPESVKELKTEIFHLRVQLDKYQKDKSEIEVRLDEIYNENKRLRNTIEILSKTNSVIAERAENSSIIQNEVLLENIENSFKQFMAFLDMLRQSGLGKIVTAAGMDQFGESQNLLFGNTQHVRSKVNSSTKIHFDNEELENKKLNTNQIDNDLKKRTENIENENHLLHLSKSKLEEHGYDFLGNTTAEGDCAVPKLNLSMNNNSDEDNEILESVGWKNSENLQKPNPKSNQFPGFATGDGPTNTNERLSYDTIEDPVDKVRSPSKSINEASELFDDAHWNNQDDDYQSSTSSLATHSKVTKATNEAQPAYVEDSTLVTESMENGMDNDMNFTRQLTLDATQDISFDNSYHDLY